MVAMTDNTVLVYLSERTETNTTVQVETVQGEGDDVTMASFEVTDDEPLDVLGPIFSRVFDELGLTLSDPGDFSWEDLSKAPDTMREGTYLVTINCEFTED